jgi:hypothetical protein
MDLTFSHLTFSRYARHAGGANLPQPIPFVPPQPMPPARPLLEDPEPEIVEPPLPGHFPLLGVHALLCD